MSSPPDRTEVSRSQLRPKGRHLLAAGGAEVSPGRFRALATAVVSGAVLSLPFLPVPYLGLLVPVCVIPLFRLARAHVTDRRANAASTWLAGYLYGFGFFLGLFYWIPQLVPDNLVFPWIIWPAWVLMALYLAIFPAVAFWIAVWTARRSRLPLGIILPAAWTLAEWARCQGALGLPWGSVAYALVDLPILIQTLDLYGLFGLSFVVLWIGGRLSRGRLRSLVAAATVIAVLIAYGGWRLGEEPPGEGIEIALVQPNLGASEKWEPENQEVVFTGLLEQSSRVVPDSIDLVVWPETATPFRLLWSRKHLDQLRPWIEQHDTALLTGTPHLEWEGETALHYNAAVRLMPGAGDTAVYRKHQLVPFSEWLPWRILRIMEINFGQADFTPGQSTQPVSLGEHRAGVLICIEAIFPQLTRATVRAGADFLVTITNDVWFGDSPAPYQHAAMARFRCVEARRPLARAANTGISMFVDRRGTVSADLGTFEKGEIRGIIHPERTTTLYTRLGDWMVAVCGAIVTASLLWRRQRGGDAPAGGIPQ